MYWVEGDCIFKWNLRVLVSVKNHGFYHLKYFAVYRLAEQISPTKKLLKNNQIHLQNNWSLHSFTFKLQKYDKHLLCFVAFDFGIDGRGNINSTCSNQCGENQYQIIHEVLYYFLSVFFPNLILII